MFDIAFITRSSGLLAASVSASCIYRAVKGCFVMKYMHMLVIILSRLIFYPKAIIHTVGDVVKWVLWSLIPHTSIRSVLLARCNRIKPGWSNSPASITFSDKPFNTDLK